MEVNLPEELQRIYDLVKDDLVKDLRQRKTEACQGEFDFSKLRPQSEPLFVGDVPLIEHMREDIAEAGKFLRAKLIRDRMGEKTIASVKDYAYALGIPEQYFFHPHPDEIKESVFFPLGGRTLLRDFEKRRYVDEASGEYVLAVPLGLYLNFRARRGSRPDAPVALIDWGTGDLKIEFQLNQKYLSQFLV